MFVFAKVIPKTLLFPFFSGHGVDRRKFHEAEWRERRHIAAAGVGL